MHHVRLESATLEDAVVRLLVTAEALLEPVLVAVERVCVLHDELAHAQEPAARPRLVAFLRAEVVPLLRQLPVRLQLRAVQRERLLVRHREDVWPAAAILEPEELRDAEPPRLLPELGRREHRREHLLAA